MRYECGMNESGWLGDRASVRRFSRRPRSRELPTPRLSSEWISLISLSLAWLRRLLQYRRQTLHETNGESYLYGPFRQESKRDNCKIAFC